MAILIPARLSSFLLDSAIFYLYFIFLVVRIWLSLGGLAEVIWPGFLLPIIAIVFPLDEESWLFEYIVAYVGEVWHKLLVYIYSAVSFCALIIND